MEPITRIAELEAELAVRRDEARELERQRGEALGEVQELRIHLASIEHQIDLMRGSYEELTRIKSSRSFAIAEKLSAMASRMRR